MLHRKSSLHQSKLSRLIHTDNHDIENSTSFHQQRNKQIRNDRQAQFEEMPIQMSKSFGDILEGESINRDHILEYNNSMASGWLQVCPTCRKWQKWALTHEQDMLNLEQQLMDKESCFREQTDRLLQKLNQLISEKQHLLLCCTQQKQELTQQIHKNQQLAEHIEQLSKKISQKKLDPEVIQTPSKAKKQQKKYEYTDSNSYNMRYSQFLTQNKPIGKASTIVTKPGFDSLLQTDHKESLSEWLAAKEKDPYLEKYIFENQILKDYNATLLDRLRESKYKR